MTNLLTARANTRNFYGLQVCASTEYAVQDRRRGIAMKRGTLKCSSWQMGGWISRGQGPARQDEPGSVGSLKPVKGSCSECLRPRCRKEPKDVAAASLLATSAGRPGPANVAGQGPTFASGCSLERNSNLKAAQAVEIECMLSIEDAVKSTRATCRFDKK